MLASAPVRFSLLVLLTVTACGVVAVSVGGFELLVPTAAGQGSSAWPLRLAGLVMATVGVAVLVAQRSRSSMTGTLAGDPIAGSLRRAATIMGLLALVALMVRPSVHPGETLTPGPRSSEEETQPRREMGTDSSSPGGLRGSGRGGGGSGGRARGGGAGRSTTIGFGAPQNRTLLERLSGSLTLQLLLLLVVLSILLLLRRRRRRWVPGFESGPLDSEEAEAGLEASLADLGWEDREPREQITAAYLRLLRVLADAGAGRRRHEAPHEHLLRALGPMGVRPEPLHRLAHLYVMAQFSERTITPRHRAEAAEALQNSLDGLRSVGSYAQGPVRGTPARAPA